MAIFGKDGTVTYEGAVLAVESRTVRIMSDVWAIEYYATVIEADGVSKVVTLGNDEFREYMSTAKVDAPQAVIEKWKAEVKAAQERALAEEIARDRAARAENFCSRIEAGRNVVVVRGRKVAIGTKGTVKIVRGGNYGTSALIATVVKDVWVNIGNLAVDHALLTNGEPISGETWESVQAAMMREEDARLAAMPKNGDKVRFKADPSRQGVVFWVRGDRLGFKETPSSDPVWANASDVEAVTADFTIPENIAASLPAPFNRLSVLKPDGDKYLALDVKGRVIAMMPPTSAMALIERVSA